jgi:hypothetical protein
MYRALLQAFSLNQTNEAAKRTKGNRRKQAHSLQLSLRLRGRSSGYTMTISILNKKLPDKKKLKKN